MKPAFRKSIAAITVSLMAITPVAVGITALTTDAAIAKSKKKGHKGPSLIRNIQTAVHSATGIHVPKGVVGVAVHTATNYVAPRTAAQAAHTAASQGVTAGTIGSVAQTVVGQEMGAGQVTRSNIQPGALNAANANQNGLEHAAPESMPGKLFAYQQTGGMNAEQVTAYNEARGQASTLEAMSDADKLARFDTDGDGVLSGDEAQAYLDALTASQSIVDQYSDAYRALAALIEGGQALNSNDLDKLNARLGL